MKKFQFLLKVMFSLVVAFFFCASIAGAGTVDPALPAYVKVEGISGNLNSVGSDTLNNLMTFWTEKFKKFYPNVNIQVEGKGSSTAPPALISATSQLGPMSRQMKDKEIDEFEKQFGYKPTQIRVAVDALAVFINKDNPIAGMSLDQVDGIFSRNQRRGHSRAKTWGDIGMKGDYANRPISIYGRNSASGTYGFFKEVALEKGDYRNEVKEQPGSASVVQSVGVDRYAIGYSGIGYKTANVRAVPLSVSGTNYVQPTLENAISGDYPLARFLYVYVNKAPGKPLDPLVHEFLKMVLSKEGQEIVVKGGYFPLSSSVAGEDLTVLGGKPAM
ncbi:MAG: phosphate-binding protein [Nitrospinae bacterium CG11_big_fil_rev_8_21_14_0_20_56_8]|nr:MAG: phosphate-binding protein [Nitrospinae bacterium CG11_big_fil_rev_8_21_14_0_20_56_8]